MATGFVQIIEFRTSRIDEVRALRGQWEAAIGAARTGTRGLLTGDRDSAGTYVQIIEFPSYEAAMANSDHPATSSFAGQMAALCDGPVTFRNLDVVEDITFG